MILVINNTPLMAGLMKDSTSRSIILNKHFEFCSPDYIITEIRKYEEYICRKACISHEEFDVLLHTLLERISLVPYEKFENEFDDALQMMKNIDIKDAPYLAVGMAMSVDGIWSDDKHFRKQNILRTYSTKEMVVLLEKRRFL